MGILRSLIFFLLCYYFLKFFYRFIKLSQKKPGKKNNPFQNQASQGMIMEEMKKCPSCGTFNPKSIALIKNENFFCNEKCLNK